MSNKSKNTSFMNLWKADSAFESLKGITNHSKDP